MISNQSAFSRIRHVLPDWHHYRSLGQNPRNIPAGQWERVSLSGTGNKEIMAEHELRLTYEVISD